MMHETYKVHYCKTHSGICYPFCRNIKRFVWPCAMRNTYTKIYLPFTHNTVKGTFPYFRCFFPKYPTAYSINIALQVIRISQISILYNTHLYVEHYFLQSLLYSTIVKYTFVYNIYPVFYHI